MLKRLGKLVLRQKRTCEQSCHSSCVFLVLFDVAGVEKGIFSNWDCHYLGYMAKKLPRDITM